MSETELPKYSIRSSSEVSTALGIADLFLGNKLVPEIVEGQTEAETNTYQWRSDGNTYVAAKVINNHGVPILYAAKVEYESTESSRGLMTDYVLHLVEKKFTTDRIYSDEQTEELQRELTRGSHDLLAAEQEFKFEVGDLMPKEGDWQAFLLLLARAAVHKDDERLRVLSSLSVSASL